MIESAERRPILVLLTLTLLNLLLVSVQIRSPEGRTLLRSWALLVATPFVTAIDFGIDGVSNAANRYLLLVGTEAENEQLREENERLRLELAQMSNVRQMVERSRFFGPVRDQLQFETLLAGVIWRSDLYTRRIVINAGTGSGVDYDSAVVTSQGIVGRVLAATPFSAEVELITNAGAAAGAVLDPSRLQGVVEGSGGRLLTLNFIPNSEIVEPNQLVYTSGADRIYPKGLPIGRVVQAARGGTYQQIRVEPLVDFSRLDEVMVVLPAS